MVHLGDVEPSAARSLARRRRRPAPSRGDPAGKPGARPHAPSLVIAETRQGFVCASAGVDASNAKGPDTLVLLPVDPDASAARLRDRIAKLSGVEVGVIVSDSFGRAWRLGTTDVALGVAGIPPILDLDGQLDSSATSCMRRRSPSPTRSREPHSS